MLILTHAGSLGLAQSESSQGGDHLLLALARGTTCTRIAANEQVALGFCGHVVSPNLPLWPNTNTLLPCDAAAKTKTNALANVDGVFALAVLDRVAGKLVLRADRYGMQPLYWLLVEKVLMFSTSLDLLIHAAPSLLHLDLSASAQFMHFHYCLGDRTLVQEIRRVPQGESLNWDIGQGHVQLAREFDYGAMPAPSIWEPEAASEALARALLSSVSRRVCHTREQVCLLSGGFDSRAISAALHKLGQPFRTVTTYGDLGVLDDLDAAAWVAEALGVENEQLDLPVDYLQENWQHKCRLTDFATTMHSWLMPLAFQHNAEGAVNFDGIAGDVVLKGLLLREEHLALLERGEHEALLQCTLNLHGVGAVLRYAVTPEMSESMRASLRADVTTELQRFGNHPNTLSYFILCNRTRRAIAASPYNLLASRLHNLAPFLDHELFELGMAIAPRCKLDGSLYRDLIRKIAPELQAIPSSNDSEWPEARPRRRRPRMCLASSSALASYLDVIEQSSERLNGLVNQRWLDGARVAANAGPAERRSVFSDAQALGELSYFVSLYKDKLARSLL